MLTYHNKELLEQLLTKLIELRDSLSCVDELWGDDVYCSFIINNKRYELTSICLTRNDDNAREIEADYYIARRTWYSISVGITNTTISINRITLDWADDTSYETEVVYQDGVWKV